MQIGEIEQIAQRIVDATAPLVGGRTINIMDVEGIIIASSDRERLGAFHPGAAQAVKSGDVVRISREDRQRYPGAREGINLPIMRGETPIGAVGIHGDPDTVEDAANLLRVCVGLYLEQETAARLRQQQKDQRGRLLRGLVLSEHYEESDAIHQGQPCRLPLLAVVIRPPIPSEAAAVLVENELVRRRLLCPEKDVYGIINDLLVAVLPAQEQADGRCGELLEAMGEKGLVAVGMPARRWEDVKLSYREALSLSRLVPEGYADASENRYKLLCLMDGVRSPAQSRILSPMYEALVAGVGEKEIERTIETMRVYCKSGGSIGVAAQELHIHKNTLLYRVKKIVTLLGMETEEAFTREYFLRLLLIYCDILKGLKT